MTLLLANDGTPYIELSAKAVIRLEKDQPVQWELDKARDELRETPDNVKRALEELKRLIEDEPDFVFPVDDEDYMIEFLRPCKYYAESTMQLMRHYYGFKRRHPAYCDKLLPQDNRVAFEQGVISFLPHRDRNGSRIVCIQVGTKWKPASCSLWDIFKGLQLALEAAMNEPRTQIHGVRAVLDMEGLALNHVYQFTPQFAKLAAGWVQTCVPIRLKGVHVVNQPYLFNMLFQLFKPFLTQKLRKRIHFHGGEFSTLCESLGGECLPEAWGGASAAPPADGRLLSELLCHYQDQFELAAKWGYKKATEDKKEKK